MLKFTHKKKDDYIRDLLVRENDFITNLLEMYPLPETKDDDDSAQYLLPTKKNSKLENGSATTPNAVSTKEEKLDAQKRHDVLVNKREAQKKHKSSNNKVNKQDRKKAKQEKQQKIKMVKLALNAKQIETIKQEKDDKKNVQLVPTFNQASSLLFSKIEFPGKKKNSKIEPKRQLQMIRDEERKIKNLLAAGEEEKVEKLKADNAWKKALEKTQGKKPKDDVELIKKTIRKRDSQKKKSIDKWKQRKDKIEKEKDGRAKKRNENIAKKIQTKKVKKMKGLTKRGRVIPGY